MRSVFGLTVVAVFGALLLLGGCGGSGGSGENDLDLATRIINADDRAHEFDCDCEVADGMYSSQAMCIDIKWIDEPAPERACLAEAIAQFPDETSAVACQVDSLEATLDCVAAAGCGGDASHCFAEGLPGEGCPAISTSSLTGSRSRTTMSRL